MRARSPWLYDGASRSSWGSVAPRAPSQPTGVELTAAEQAAAEGVPVMTVYRARARLKEQLAADPVLLELWSE